MFRSLHNFFLYLLWRRWQLVSKIDWLGAAFFAFGGTPIKQEELSIEFLPMGLISRIASLMWPLQSGAGNGSRMSHLLAGATILSSLRNGILRQFNAR